MGLCCFTVYFFPHPPLHVLRLIPPSPSPSSSSAPSGLSCCCNVVVVYHWTSDANLCFALALCPLLVVVHILSPRPPSPSVPSIVLPVTTISRFFNIHFDSPFPVPSPPFSPSFFFNACDVCIGLFWCDQSSTPKFARKIKTPAHSKTLHHDWLLPPGDDLPCPLPPPVCPALP